jgi:hypothetical protein
MPPFDDSPVDNPASETEGRQGPNPATPRRSIGPESEARGGREAPAETLRPASFASGLNAGGGNPSDPPKPPGQPPPEVPNPGEQIPIEEPPHPMPVPPNEPPPPIVAAVML